MENSKKKIRRAFAPYIRESIYCLIIDVIVMGLLITGFVYFRVGEISPLLSWVFPVYFVLEIFLGYRLALIYVCFENNGAVAEEIIGKIVSIDYDKSISAKFDNSIIPKLYPKELKMERYKITIETENQKRIKLRTAMSKRKFERIFDLTLRKSDSMSNPDIKFIYGEYSKIIYYLSARTNVKGNPYLDLNAML